MCAIITEEDEGIIYTGNNDGKYVVALDPLDGSSNIDVNVSIGTIFSIYRRISPEGTLANEADFLQGGRSQVAAGYILYGSSTILVYSTGKGVNCFTYENSLGEFFMSQTNVLAPKNGNIFSINYGNLIEWGRYVFRMSRLEIDGPEHRPFGARNLQKTFFYMNYVINKCINILILKQPIN